MRLLLLSCHSVLEYDLLRMWHDLGYEVFSLGAYTTPSGDKGHRPGLPQLPYDVQFINLALQFSKEQLHPEQLEGFDAVIIMHKPEWICNNWHVFKQFPNLRVIWHSIGQSVEGVERLLEVFRRDGLEIVRYSPKEANIPGFIGADAVIRFSKRPEDYADWTGSSNNIINFTQSLRKRGTHCGYPFIDALAKEIDIEVYGPGNEDVPYSRGVVSFEEQNQLLQEAAAFVCTGTHPASYTLAFMEAMMAGTPIVALGPLLGSPSNSGYYQDTYEIPELLDGAGYFTDDFDNFLARLKKLQAEPVYAQLVSFATQKRAVELFDEKKIGKQWKEFLA